MGVGSKRRGVGWVVRGGSVRVGSKRLGVGVGSTRRGVGVSKR